MLFFATLLASFVLISKTQAGSLDLCSIGRDGLNTGLLNGNWTFMGYDSTNNNTAFWYHECYNVALEWGVKYLGAGNEFYVIKPQDSVTYYGYCGFTYTYPFGCGGAWYLWDGSSFTLDDQWLVAYCSAFTTVTDCNNVDYVNKTLNMPVSDEFCFENASVRTDIEGKYTYTGCDEGVPYYQHTSTIDYYLHFDWCSATWLIGSDIATTTVYSYCASYNILNCDNNLISYDGSGFTADTQVDVGTCQPTSAPTSVPTIDIATTVCTPNPFFFLIFNFSFFLLPFLGSCENAYFFLQVQGKVKVVSRTGVQAENI